MLYIITFYAFGLENMYFPSLLVICMTLYGVQACDKDSCTAGIAVAEAGCAAVSAVGGAACVATGWATFGLSCLGLAAAAVCTTVLECEDFVIEATAV